jgi:hypothetical protein
MLASVCLIRKVALTTSIPVRDLIGRRPRYIVRLRQAMGMVAKNRFNIAYAEFGRQVGLDHSTVMYGCQTLLSKMKAREPEALKAYRVVIRAHLHVKAELARDRSLARREFLRAFPPPDELKQDEDEMDQLTRYVQQHLFVERDRSHNTPKNMKYLERQRRVIAA